MPEGSSSIVVINPDGGVSNEYDITVIRPCLISLPAQGL